MIALYALVIFTNISLALSFNFKFLSGCHFFANNLYCFLTSSMFAVGFNSNNFQEDSNLEWFFFLERFLSSISLKKLKVSFTFLLKLLVPNFHDGLSHVVDFLISFSNCSSVRPSKKFHDLLKSLMCSIQ